MKYTLLSLFLSFYSLAGVAQAPGLDIDFITWGSSPKEMETKLIEADIPFTPYDAQHKTPCSSFRYEGLRTRFLYEKEVLLQIKLTKAFGLSEMEQAEEALNAWEDKIAAALPNIVPVASRNDQQSTIIWKTAEVKVKLTLLFGMNLEILYTRSDKSLESTARNWTFFSQPSSKKQLFILPNKGKAFS